MTVAARITGYLSRARAAATRLIGLGRRTEDETRIREEMRFHLDQLAGHYRSVGLSPDEARRRAHLEFGSLAAHQEAARESLRSRLLEDAIRDLRFGFRSLRRRPGFALTTVVTIGLGIAAAVTVFTIVDSIFLRRLPVPGSDRFVSVSFLRPDGREDWPGSAGAEILRARASAFDVVVSHDSREVLYVAGHGSATQRFGAFVSPDYFGLLGAKPYLGRFFAPSEDSIVGRDAVAVIGYDLWRTQFNADSNVVGEHMQVRSRDVTVIGVAPRGFVGISVGGAPNDVWLPTRMLGVMDVSCIGQPGCRETAVIARLRPGATLAAARAQVNVLARSLGHAAFGRDTVPDVVAAPVRGMAANRRSEYLPLVNLLGGIALLISIITCANVGGLLVTRGLSRGQEIALRFSLGAGRGRVIRQLVAENLLIGLAGGATGMVLSIGCVRMLMGFFVRDSEGFPRFFYLGLDVRVLVFALLASLGAVLLFGILPAVTTSRLALGTHAAGSRVVGRGRGRLVLISAQVALSLSLLVGAGLMARSYRSLMYRQQFDPEHMALVRLRPALIKYDPSRAQRFLHDVVDRLRRMPDVSAVVFGRGIGYLWTEGPTTMPLGRTATDTNLTAYPRFVSPGFLAGLRIPLREGREFTDGDVEGAPLVAIVTESLARKVWPQGDALDRTMILGGKTFRVVGVAADYAVHTASDSPLPIVLVPFWQNAFQPEVDARLGIRVRGDPKAALPVLTRAINDIDPDVPVTELMAMSDQVDVDNTSVHLCAVVLIVAAAVGLFLSGLGLYGVVTHLVEQRTREIGVRIAMGAQPRQIVALILRQGAGATLAGAVAGLMIAALAARLLAAYLVGVVPGDRMAFGAAVAAVTLVATVASYLPARKAARLDPMTALRVE